MKKEEVTCDVCQRDLTTTTNCEGWRMLLTCEAIPPRGNTVTLMHVAPQLDRSYHFCGFKCFKEWSNSH